MHENEIVLVRRVPSGNLIATREFDKTNREAKKLGYWHVNAMWEQIDRQKAALVTQAA
jgi:hypothetical protein